MKIFMVEGITIGIFGLELSSVLSKAAYTSCVRYKGDSRL